MHAACAVFVVCSYIWASHHAVGSRFMARRTLFLSYRHSSDVGQKPGAPFSLRIAAGRNVWCSAKRATGPSRRPTSWPNHRRGQGLVFNWILVFSTTSGGSRRGFRRIEKKDVVSVAKGKHVSGPSATRVCHVRFSYSKPQVLSFIYL